VGSDEELAAYAIGCARALISKGDHPGFIEGPGGARDVGDSPAPSGARFPTAALHAESAHGAVKLLPVVPAGGAKGEEISRGRIGRRGDGYLDVAGGGVEGDAHIVWVGKKRI